MPGAVTGGEILLARDVLLTEPVHEPTRAHDLVRAGVGGPLLAGHAGAVEAAQSRGGAGRALRQTAEARVLGPDAGVHHADDPPAAGAVGAPLAGPGAALSVEPQQVARTAGHERRGAHPVDVLLGAALHADHSRDRTQPLDLPAAQRRGEPVQGSGVSVDDLRMTDAAEHLVLVGQQSPAVRRHGGTGSVETRAVAGLGAREAVPCASVG